MLGIVLFYWSAGLSRAGVVGFGVGLQLASWFPVWAGGFFACYGVELLCRLCILTIVAQGSTRGVVGEAECSSTSISSV